MLQIFLLLVLQKPQFKSKHREYVKYFNKRLECWEHKKLQELISEYKEIQSRLSKSVKNRKTSRPERLL